ncbi:MAG: N-acetylmuramoyl-L-alanine amidase [Faecalibacterium sp.]|nr:N-acetylmuramoyl-L-alanine amidase [Ruminococcus sp.]MCM1485870.1 N-acetylmuramoyl-L-alanine amidase [Faecalibacterium sp.]
MMKKRNIILICISILVAVAAIIIILTKFSGSPNILTQGKTTTDMRDGELKKAKNMSNFVVLTEGKDITLLNEDSSQKEKNKTEKTIKAVASSVFDSVILKTDYLTEKADEKSRDYQTPNAEMSADILSCAKSLNAKKLKVYLQLDITHSPSFVAELCKNGSVSGVVLSGADKMAAAEINKKMKAISDSLKQESKKKELCLWVKAERTDLSKLKAENLMLTVPSADGETDIYNSLNDIYAEKKTNVKLCFPISKCSEDGLKSSWLLEQMLKADECDFISARVFDSYSAVENDYDNCFTAVETFIRSGINISAVFSNLIIENYSGEIVHTNEYKLNVNIRGSYLYPVTLGKQKIMLSESGKAEVELEMKTGENVFAFEQNGNEAEYKVNVEFNGDVIRSVEPADTVYASAKQNVNVTVTAAEGADITVKLGTEKYTAEQSKYIGDGYCVYTAKIKMPSSRIEIESLGSLSVTAVFGDSSISVDGAKIVYKDKKTTPEVTTTAPHITLPADNFNSYTTDISTTTILPPINTPTTSAAITQMIYPSASAYTGNQMCVVNTDYADTWPLGNDDKFVPYQTTLVRGTMDYVVGESEAYDSEEGETRTFYTLASGRRIQRKSVSLIEQVDVGDNELSVLGCASENGALRITLSTKWKVPYSFSFNPQEYYASKGRLYNVRAFTASYIQFTFYHTTAANGQVDTNGSSIVSSASWSVDPSQKIAVLTLPLRSQGRYYGYSLEYDANGNLVLTIHSKPQTLAGSVIVLDPGHGGKDGGAPGYSNWLNESAVNFSAAVMVKNELESRGATVYMTRYEDKYVTLEERKAFARAVKPDVFVSIHSNASEDTSAYGTSVYYYKPMSQPLSQSIYTELVSTFKNYVYLNDTARQSGIERGSNFNPFSVTRLEECPSVLVEMGFVTNELECIKLADEGCRQKIAAAIANGIEKYIVNF